MPPLMAAIPSNLVESLGCKSPHDALLALAAESESTALKLSEELAASLSSSGRKHAASSGAAGGGRRGGKREDNDSSASGVGGSNGHFIPLPRSLRDAPRPTRILANTITSTNIISTTIFNKSISC